MNLLLVAVWFRRGHTYLAAQARDALLGSGHRVHVLARTGHIEGTPTFDDRDELHLDEGDVTRVPRYRVEAGDFRALLDAHRFDGVVFVEEQWQAELGAVTRERRIPSLNVVMWEFFHPAERSYGNFNVLVFPTRCGAERADRAGYRSVHVPWGVDLDLWAGPRAAHGDGVRFLHCSGWGGGHKRKQTDFVIEAFKRVRRPGARLLVHRQTLAEGATREQAAPNIDVLTANLTRAEVAGLYRQADCALAPSKWEGLGYSLLEPQAAGVPVVALDAPPMNEVVEDGHTGVLLPVDRFERYPGIAVPAAITGEDRFVACLEALVDERERLAAMGANAARRAQERFDWGRNQRAFVDVVQRTVADPPPPGRRPSAQIAALLRR